MKIHFWELFPKLYDLIQIIATGGFLNKVLKKIDFAKNKNILELGCGTGTLSKYLACKEYTGVDINPEFIESAKMKFPKHSFKVMDIVKQKLPEGEFDYVVTMNVLHHLTDDELVKLLKKISKLKRTRKYLIIEGKPAGLLAPLLATLDAGSNFRQFKSLENYISKYFKVNKKFQVKSGFGTYNYFIANCHPYE